VNETSAKPVDDTDRVVGTFIAVDDEQDFSLGAHDVIDHLKS